VDQYNLGSSLPGAPQAPGAPPMPGMSAGPVAAPRPVPVYLWPAPGAGQPARPSFVVGLLRYLFILVFFVSLIVNFYLGMIVLAQREEEEYRPGWKNQRIALVELKGMIDLDRASEFREQLRRAANDDTVKGVVVVINSPGGQVVPSELMHKYSKDFLKLPKKKRLYAAIEQVGASGAYWTAAAAEKIYAQENAAVGSIGVIYLNLVVQGLLEQKLDVAPVVIKSSRSPFKDEGSPFRLPTEQERGRIQEDLDRVHERFVKVVCAARGLTEQEGWAVADGQVYDGPEALGKKLIDEVGSLDDAINDLAKALDLERPMVVRYAKRQSLLEMLTGASGGAHPLDLGKQLQKWAMTPRIQALWLGQ